MMQVQALGGVIACVAPPAALRRLAPLLADLPPRSDDVPSDRPDAPTHRIEFTRCGLRRWRVSCDGEVLISGAPWFEAVAEAFVAMNIIAATSSAERDAVLHASVVEFNGAAVALVGVSESGKSTLAAVAVQLGWGYIADEVCAVDVASLEVRAYHRPIGVRTGGTRSRPLVVSELAAGGLVGLAPLSLIVLVDRGETVPTLTPLTPSEALVELTDATVMAAGRELEFFHRLERIVRGVPVVRCSYTEAIEAVPALAVYLTDLGSAERGS